MYYVADMVGFCGITGVVSSLQIIPIFRSRFLGSIAKLFVSADWFYLINDER
jgi:hypothetical protein